MSKKDALAVGAGDEATAWACLSEIDALAAGAGKIDTLAAGCVGAGAGTSDTEDAPAVGAGRCAASTARSEGVVGGRVQERVGRRWLGRREGKLLGQSCWHKLCWQEWRWRF